MSSGFRFPGAGPQLKVVSAPAFDRLPVAAKGLGVVTDLPVAKVTLSTLAPTSPQPGDIWFEVGRFAQAVPINTRPEVLVAPQACYQFDGTTWSRRDGFCAVNSAWMPLRTYLYIDGTVVTEIATSILSGTNNGGSRSDGADGITISAQKSSDQWSRHMTIYSPIVFAGYKKICAEWMALANYTVSGTAALCALTATGSTTISGAPLAVRHEPLPAHPAGEVFSTELDISGMSDNFRAAAGISTDSSSAASVKLTKLWLS